MENNTAYGSEEVNDLDYETAGRIGLSQLQQHIERDYKNI